MRVAHDGETALMVAQSFLSDIVWLDIGLPRLSDYEVAKQLRAMPEIQNTILIALTGYGQPASAAPHKPASIIV